MSFFEEFLEEDLDKYFKRLTEFSYVENFDLIHKGLLNLRDNQQFIEMGRIPKTGFNKENRKWKFEEDKIPFIKAANDGMSNFPLLYLPPITKVVQYDFFIALYTMIQLNYIYCANEKLDDDDYKNIILGDVAAYFTYFVEDFENPGKIPEPSEDFFKQITNMKYETKDVNKFFNCIWDIISPYTTAYRSGMNYCRTIGFAALYLSACSALKNNRDSISFEDVITGYLTIFKLFYIDIRPLVKKGYANYRGFYYKNKKAGYPKKILWADYYSTEKQKWQENLKGIFVYNQLSIEKVRDMAFGDFIRAVKADLKHDDSIVEDYDWDRFIGFKKFDINRFDELLEIIENLSVNERFSSLHKFPVKEDGNAFDWNMEKTPFYNGAVKGLGLSHMIPFYMTSITHKLVDAKSIATTFSMVQMSFNYDNQHFLTYEEDKTITLSFIVEYLTFFVEDFDNPNNHLVKRSQKEYADFFKKLHNIFWEDDKVKDFEYAVYSVVVDSTDGGNLDDQAFIQTLGRAVNYLIGCSALKEGRDCITCEDVVIGYLTVFKIILNDMRPLVYSLYDEEKWSDESSWK